jgi:hypothetical protein
VGIYIPLRPPARPLEGYSTRASHSSTLGVVLAIPRQHYHCPGPSLDLITCDLRVNYPLGYRLPDESENADDTNEIHDNNRTNIVNKPIKLTTPTPTRPTILPKPTGPTNFKSMSKHSQKGFHLFEFMAHTPRTRQDLKNLQSFSLYIVCSPLSYWRQHTLWYASIV